ncbi:hypothetical protein IV203_020112 [Nitzschia inconspicua]|uniref:Uncharacterized protein n=1 Tax=Nitzschia inconspicua TaxID=303405 RepID=A0A9K3K8M5_9STRA|nr:hypothetical protein IV203_020481 [Nitzschia inconspicua]KAG7371542.1 hypothetical protein IV203_020112 [Nitzschia inconspicua]
MRPPLPPPLLVLIHHLSIAIAIRPPLPLLINIRRFCHCESFAITMANANHLLDEIDVAVAALKCAEMDSNVALQRILVQAYR